ncbi:uncharacterized protein LOC124812226 [Hydra vulgaris]|uniref:uncharacterized protein LOC124812226 n=1 Tax=Hydra vulgaris TaxID=6087 RepID=UPI001F5E448C|nr:uncharacterized protein LOC124812226 [Hydra vulgaris]
MIVTFVTYCRQFQIILWTNFLLFLVESTQPITVPSTSAIRVTSSAPTTTIPCVQPSAGWVRLGRKRGVWRGKCPVPYVNLYTTYICCKYVCSKLSTTDNKTPFHRICL